MARRRSAGRALHGNLCVGGGEGDGCEDWVLAGCIWWGGVEGESEDGGAVGEHEDESGGEGWESYVNDGYTVELLA